jgi:hypothetical protein
MKSIATCDIYFINLIRNLTWKIYSNISNILVGNLYEIGV